MDKNDVALSFGSFSVEDAKLLQPLVLATVGDSVQTLFVRGYIVRKVGAKVNQINKMVSSVVNAGSQCETFKKIEKDFNEEEISIAMRARNAHTHSKAKNYSYQEYIYATALEAVFGFLYLTGQTERLSLFLNMSLDNKF